jgi:hypothetical protein
MTDLDKLFKIDTKDLRLSALKSRNGTKGRERLQEKGIDFAQDVVKVKRPQDDKRRTNR